jgi:hypothetical protein
MGAHSFFSPSASARWLNCTGSMALIRDLPESPENEAQRGGTFEHSASEFCLMHDIDSARELVGNAEFAAFIEDTLGYSYNVEDYLQDDSIEAIDGAIGYARNIPGKRHLELYLDIHHLIPDTGGTGDVIAIEETDGKRKLHVADFKFGRGVRVDAKENTQLGIYAIGAMRRFGGDFHEVRLHIIQPRLHAYDEWSASHQWLDALADRVKAAYDANLCGDGEFNPGEKQCMWCPAAATCTAYMKYVKDTVSLEFDSADWPLKDARALQPDELALIVLPQLDAVEAWVKSERSHCTKAAIEGAEFPGYKLVEATTKRRWKDEGAAADILLFELGKSEDQIFKQKLLGIGDAEKLVGKANMEKLADAIVKPKGGAILVRSDDKRPAVNPKEAVAAEFDSFDSE